MIKYSARGTEFTISKKLLQKYPDSLMSILENNSNNIHKDKLNDCLFIDVNPNSIKYIVEYYNFGTYSNSGNLFITMDLNYLGFNVDSKTSQCVMDPIIYDEQINNEKQECITTWNNIGGIINIRTTNNKIITIYKNHNEHFKKFIDMITINITDVIINCHIDAPDNITHMILSVIRDGYNIYYEYLSSALDHNVFLNKYINVLEDEEYNIKNYCDAISDYECETHYYGHFDSDEKKKCHRCTDTYEEKLDQAMKEVYSKKIQLKINKDIQKTINKIKDASHILGDYVCNAIEENVQYVPKDILLKYLKMYDITNEFVDEQLRNRIFRNNLFKNNINHIHNRLYGEEKSFLGTNGDAGRGIYFLEDNVYNILYTNCEKFRGLMRNMKPTRYCGTRVYHIVGMTEEKNEELTKYMYNYFIGL